MDSYQKFKNAKSSLDLDLDEDVQREGLRYPDINNTTNTMSDCDKIFPNLITSPTSTSLGISKRVRLRAVETEKEFFFKLLNVSSIRRLAIVQAWLSAFIIISQVFLFAFGTLGDYKLVDFTGMGIWCPMLFFSVASGLSYLAIKSPTGCLLGTAMGFEIISTIFGTILIILASISLTQHAQQPRYSGDWNSEINDSKVPGRIFCSIMVLSAVGVVITSIFISVQFCRATCCGRYKATESVLFDVETVKL